MEYRDPDEIPAGTKRKILIEIMNGPDDGHAVVCDTMPISMGRGSDETVHLPYDHLISRHHARITRTGGKFVLSDLNSTNGTFIGKKKIREDTVMETNRLFRVGATQLMIRIRAAGASPE